MKITCVVTFLLEVITSREQPMSVRSLNLFYWREGLDLFAIICSFEKKSPYTKNSNTFSHSAEKSRRVIVQRSDSAKTLVGGV